MDKAVVNLTREEFLLRNRISEDSWVKSECNWDILKAIGSDHQSQIATLQDTGELIAKVIQKIKKVHSVRWRVKDTEHLMEKIVRKKIERPDKYSNITPDNYFEAVTDLVGVRALHLFKNDCFDIDPELKSTWKILETPIAYMRDGDPIELKHRFTEGGFDIKVHPAGYRSVHYVIASQPLSRRVTAEVQVRTIFEEGWSEIDHQVRYPNFSDNRLVQYFLAIFNRQAGSADEMGSFVRTLVETLELGRAHLKQEQDRHARTIDEKMQILSKLDATIQELETQKLESQASKDAVESIKGELAKLKTLNFTIPVASVSFGTTIPLPSSIITIPLPGLLSDDEIIKYLTPPGRVSRLEFDPRLREPDY
jgi:ppGpp synthetase/RelA/SpoT-type nucleotidyltranferase